MKKYLACLCIVSVFLCLNNVQAALIGQWTFNEGAGATCYDSSGYGNDGTLIGGATWVTAPGNKGVQLDGTTGYVDFGNAASLNLGSVFSIEAWVKLDGITGEAFILGKDPTEYGVSFYQNGYIYAYGGGSGGNNVAYAPPAHQYIYVAYTNDYSAAGDNSLLYVNGTLVASKVSAYPLQSNAGEHLVFGTDRLLGGWINGSADELRLYNNVLSSQDISNNYAAGPMIPEPATCILLTCGIFGVMRRNRV